MTAPAPPPAPPRRRRWWPAAAVTAWAALVAAAAVWSAGNDPATVPEQRDVAQALPALDRAAAAVLTAADAPDRVVELGPREVADCSLTGARTGAQAVREVVLHVRAGLAATALRAVAGRLPGDYRAEVARTGSRYALRADAGGFVTVDADTPAEAGEVVLRVDTGCRPAAAVPAAPAPPGPPPAAFTAVLRALGAPGAPVTGWALPCPGGGTAAAVRSGDLAGPPDLRVALRAVAGPAVVQADEEAWAYRTGPVSVVVGAAGQWTRVTATTPCR